MPIPGHDYGVDSGLMLKGLNWADIHPQRTADPVFAGRYFNPHVSVTWVDGETANLKVPNANGINPNLRSIFPMQNPRDSSQTKRFQGLHHFSLEIDAPPSGTRAKPGTPSFSPAGAITAIPVANGGSGYKKAPSVYIRGGDSRATATTTIDATGKVTSINLTAGGSGYREDGGIIVRIDAPPGRTARTGQVSLSSTGAITKIKVAYGGAGYKTAPAVHISSNAGSGATATTTIDTHGKVTSINVTTGGSGYKLLGLVVKIDPPPRGGEAARPGAINLNAAGTITGIAVAQGGAGYQTAPAVHISGGVGSGATATTTIDAHGVVTSINVTAGGSGYQLPGPNADLVHRWGEIDADETCSRIWDVVKKKELLFPDSRSVIVYLDIEQGVLLSPDYWHGWASKVYWFCTGFFQWPFYPGLYCTTKKDPLDPDPGQNVHRIPSDDVQNGLTLPPNSCSSRCWGVFATNPQVDPDLTHSRYDPNFLPDWQDRFNDWAQTVHVIFGLFPWDIKVKVLLWQYAMQSKPAPNNPTPSPPAFNALNVDLDETSPSGEAIRWMLKVP